MLKITYLIFILYVFNSAVFAADSVSSYFSLHQNTALAITNALSAQGYQHLPVRSGLYYQNQSDLSQKRKSLRAMPTHFVNISIAGGEFSATVTETYQGTSGGASFSTLAGVGDFQIGFVPSELGNGEISVWALVHGGRLRFELIESNRLTNWYPDPSYPFLPVGNGVVVTKHQNAEPNLYFIPNNKLHAAISLNIVPLGPIKLASISNDSFFTIGKFDNGAGVYLANTRGEVKTVGDFVNFSQSELNSKILLDSQGYYYLSSYGSLEFWTYNIEQNRAERVFCKQSGAQNSFEISRGTAVAQHRQLGQNVSYYVSPTGEEIEATTSDRRDRLTGGDQQVLNELNVIDYTSRAQDGLYLHVQSRDDLVNRVLASFVYGNRGWVNLVGLDGVHMNDIIGSIAQVLSYDSERIPRAWRDTKLVSIPFDRLMALYQAGLAVAQSGSGAANPWALFIRALTNKKIILVFPDFIESQGNTNASAQLSFLLEAFENRFDNRDVGDLESKRIMILTTMNTKNWDWIKNQQPNLVNLTHTHEVVPPTGTELKSILIQRALDLEKTMQVEFTNESIDLSMQYSSYFFPEFAEPKRSTQLLRELASFGTTEMRTLSNSRSLVSLTEDVFRTYSRSQHNTVLNFPDLSLISERMFSKIVGQRDPINKLLQAFATIQSGFYNRQRGLGTYLLIGPKGVGKTYTVEVLEELMEIPVVYINLVGANQLIPDQKIKRLKELENLPHIVLFEEMDKAKPEVIQALHPILDRGIYPLNNSDEDQSISFAHALVFLTGNYGDLVIEQAYQTQGPVDEWNRDTYLEALQQSNFVASDSVRLEKGQIPEFIWVRTRQNLLIYTPFSIDEGIEILTGILTKFHHQILDDCGLNFNFHLSEEIAYYMVESSIEQRTNGHGIKQYIEGTLMGKISQYLIETKFDPGSITDIYLTQSSDGSQLILSNLDGPEILSLIDDSFIDVKGE